MKVKIHQSMIKRYNESDYNLQLGFLVSLRSSEGDRIYHEFLILFFYQKLKISWHCTMISLTNEMAIYFSALAKELQVI